MESRGWGMSGCPLVSRRGLERRKHNQWGMSLNFWHLELEWTHLPNDDEISISYFWEASYTDWERLNTVKTRSQAVAMIGDRIVSQQTVYSRPISDCCWTTSPAVFEILDLSILGSWPWPFRAMWGHKSRIM